MLAAYYTLGCKVNQYETEKIREDMEHRGIRTVPFGSFADVYVINTCTVTATADSKSRKAIRGAIRRNPSALVVVTGCYAHLHPDAIQAIAGVDLVVPNFAKDSIADRITGCLREAIGADQQPSTVNHQLRSRTRAIVKVQDGCDNFCAYCAVPLARGVLSSRPMSEVADEVRRLAEEGHKEIVLTGIRLGRYESEGVSLPALIRRISELNGIERIRLSSVEPMEVSDELLQTMAGLRKVCRHLHVPLQSGSDEVLRRMGRPYTGADFASLIRRARDRIPELGLTTDVMVGFPGETAEQFEATVDLVREVDFSRLHVFRFSPRPGTAAEQMPNRLSAKELERRSRALIELGKRQAQAFAERFVGHEVEVLVEGRRRTVGGDEVLVGFTDNYIEVAFRGSASLRGRIVKVRAQRAENGRLVGGWQHRDGRRAEDVGLPVLQDRRQGDSERDSL